VVGCVCVFMLPVPEWAYAPHLFFFPYNTKIRSSLAYSRKKKKEYKYYYHDMYSILHCIRVYNKLIHQICK
jgi:hypothetical protein